MEKTEVRTCSGDCKNCNVFQRAYCSAQLAYNNMNSLASLQRVLGTIEKKLEKIEERVSSSDDHPLIDPE